MNGIKRLSIGLAAAVTAAAAITWVSASGMVVLYPATVSVLLTLSSEPVTRLGVELRLTTGELATAAYAEVTPPGPYHTPLTVDGGNPSDPSDTGVAYRPSLYAYLQSSTAQQTYLRFDRSDPIVVDNTALDPSVAVPATFYYPTTYRANATISIIGGKINKYYLYTSANHSTANESYFGQTTSSDSGPAAPASITSWAPMVPNSNVHVYGIVYVTDDGGQESLRSLATQRVNMSAGGANVSWTIDLTNTGSLEGDIALVPSSGTATPTSYKVFYRGTSGSTSGISGSVSVSTSVPRYSVALTPGQYDVNLQTSFTDPPQWSETPRTTVTIAAGATTTMDFHDSLGVGRLALEVDGFYSASTLHSATSYLRGPGCRAETSQRSAAGFDHTLPVGSWQGDNTSLRTYDLSNPDLPNDNSIYIAHFVDASMPVTSVTASGITSLGTEALTLVKSNVYFDVAELAGQPEVNLVNPRIHAYRTEYNADTTSRRRIDVYSYGSSTVKPVSGLTVVAEPGMYVLEARATVSNTITRFAGSTIWFGEPVATPPGDSTVVLTPEQNPALSLTLDFEQVTAGGITTVVESPLGPAPPEGFRSVCVENADGVSCDPVYYDITSTAQWTGSTKVCVRKQLPGVINAAADFMHLYHYNETTNAWEDLPPPPDGVRAFDCSADPTVCDCADEASCGIDPSADPVRNVFLLCGMTTSFSQFAVFQGEGLFTNVVDGVEYTGPTGPPSLQQWEAPSTGTYRITAVGAQGASASSAPSLKGGHGAEVTGDFVLQAGDVVQILVGQKGTAAPNSGGGGGGTFVVKDGSPLLIAGGGGGVRAGALVDGRPGTLSTSGTAGSTSSNYTSGFVAGGANGGGGSRVHSYGAGGGGWSGNGASDGNYGKGGYAFLDAAQARGGAGQSCGAFANGGYGGGGAGNGCYGGGGGGGYSGGGGGRVGGGGGSLNTGANQGGTAGKYTPTGHGYVKIHRVGP
ncbi:MAG TPA: hypothetical protein VNO30_30270 [Kofleriaceae bacterium]|nr:hypothetical protein [Kofleriaceae bacterium]